VKTTDFQMELRMDQTVDVKMVEVPDGRHYVPLEFDAEDEIVRAPKVFEVSERDSQILGTAFRHMEGARRHEMPVTEPEWTYHSRWNNWRKNLYESAGKLISCHQCLHFAQQSVPFDHREVFIDKVSAVYYALSSHEFAWAVDLLKLGENPKSISDTVGHIADMPDDETFYSNIYFWHLRPLLLCENYVSERRRVAEIGGGYGGLARLWLKGTDVEKYFIIDLPETLFYAEVALTDEFGEGAVGYFEGSDPGTRVVLVPVTRLHQFDSTVDLVINQGSMQEMSDVWVAYYMGLLDKLNAKFFYSLNYMGSPADALFESRTFWCPRPTTAWTAKIINADPPLVKVQSAGRHFCEILYERDGAKQYFDTWQVLGGRKYLTRATYIEGLELLRKDMNPSNAIKFLNVIWSPRHRYTLPKELLFISNLFKDMDPKVMKVYDELQGLQKMVAV